MQLLYKQQQQQHQKIELPSLKLQTFALVLTAIVALLTSNSQVGALKVTVSIPELVKLNDAFWLNCSHQTTNAQNSRQRNDNVEHPIPNSRFTGDKPKQQQQPSEEIYAIKWYKDEEEFYRYLPNAEPKVSIYETNGIQLDQSKSHEGNVYLTKADVNSEGNYRCEILSEAPVFETVRKSKHLKVYALPVRGPRIEILDSNGRPKSPKAQEISYAVGDKIELRCNSAPSKPAAKLRWYLNEHELQIPTSTINISTATATAAASQALDKSYKTTIQGYDVKVTPLEFRQHYKGIFSSHSSLSLVLQQDDLINNKISFKCLASLRQEVPIQSKQLIVLTPSQATLNANARLARARRFLTPLLAANRDLISNPESEAHVQHRQRSQHLRHGISRLPQQQQQQSQRSQQQSTKFAQLQNERLINTLANGNSGDLKDRMPYVYEDSDSTLGPSIIDRPETLESYLQIASTKDEAPQLSHSTVEGSNYALEFNKGNNLEYVQWQRDKLARQRSLPIAGASSNYNNNHHYGASTTSSGSNSLKRVNSLVKSPLYLDENDSLRPIINWPPLEAGKLMLLPPSQLIVAIPTSPKSKPSDDSQQVHQRFVVPSAAAAALEIKSLSALADDSSNDQNYQFTPVLLEKLVQNLNCTCTDGAIDTKMSWQVNDLPLSPRDTRFFHAKVTPDHRQTWLTIGMQTFASASLPSSLQAILAKYYKSPESPVASSRGPPTGELIGSSNLQAIPNDQLRFTCQATHSMLLYSSSEMITFDFNPPSNFDGSTNSIDKFNPSPSNVIQATSASQSSSATGGFNQISTRSQQLIQRAIFSLTIGVMIAIKSSNRIFLLIR